MKKIIGLSTGRKNGNCEMMLKAAAMGAAESGVETEIIRAMELKVLPCKGCFACTMSRKGCMLNDDVDWILQKTMLEDAALIVATPCYHLRSNGYLMAIAERTNHIHLQHPDCMKADNPGAIIAVGNSPHWWMTLNLLTINMFVQQHKTLVDQMEVGYAMVQGSVLRHAQAVERAKQLGRNVAHALRVPKDEWKFMGEEGNTTCPVCHCDVICVPEKLPVVACPICWVHGTIRTDSNGRMSVDWDMEEAKASRFSYEAAMEHYTFVEKRILEDKAYLKTDQSKDMMEKFKAFGKIIRP